MAFSRIAAIEAAQCPRVISFRQEVLKGQLLEQKDISAWIERTRAEDGEPTKIAQLNIELAPGTDINPEARTMNAEELFYETTRKWSGFLQNLSYDAARHWDAKIVRETTQYRTLEGRIRNVSINKDGILGRLKEAAQEPIVKTALYPRCFWWQEYQAVDFILCGTVPLYSMARGETSPSLEGHDRIKMDINPRVSSKEVASSICHATERVFCWEKRCSYDGQACSLGSLYSE